MTSPVTILRRFCNRVRRNVSLYCGCHAQRTVLGVYPESGGVAKERCEACGNVALRRLPPRVAERYFCP